MFLSTPTVAHSGLLSVNVKSKSIYSTYPSLNQVELQSLMDSTRKQNPHHSKFVKQFCYYVIVFILQIRRVKILISIVNYLNQFDSGDCFQYARPSGKGMGHQDGEHKGKDLRLHTVSSLHNAGSWLGCFHSRSDFQHRLLCSTSFSGLSSLIILDINPFPGQCDEY